MKKIINCVLCADDNYSYAGITMISVLKNLSNKYTAKFFILTDNLSENTKKLFERIKKIKKCDIEYINVVPYLSLLSDVCWTNHKNNTNHHHLMSYYRLLILEVLKDKADKCIYLDSDMIINTDLSVVYEQVTSDKIGGSVVEIGAMQKRQNLLKETMRLPEFKRLNVNPRAYPYFNAGFIIFNLKKCTEYKIKEQLFTFLKNNPSPPYADQDTLNAILGQKYRDKMVYFHPAYNVFCNPELIRYDDAFYTEEQISEAFASPKICHYAGVDKPWKGKKDGFYKLWWHYCRYSPWKNKYINNKTYMLKIYLFNIITLYKHTKTAHKEIYSVLDIPLWKISQKSGYREYKLFSFIPILKIKKEL